MTSLLNARRMARSLSRVSPVLNSRGDGFYLGPVASRFAVPNNFFNGHFQARSYSAHFADEDLVAVKVVTGNWWIDGTTGVMMNSGQVQEERGVFEKLDSSKAQAKWGGETAGFTPPGENLESDWIPFILPKATRFGFRYWKQNAGGIAWTSLGNFKNTAWNEAFGSAASGITDVTMSAGTVPDAGNASNYMGPVAILGMTKNKTVVYLGDSLGAGLNDVNTASGDFGIFRYLSANHAYLNLSRSGDRAMWAKLRGAAYYGLAKYCSHAVIQHTINDLANGENVAAVQASLLAMAAAVKSANPAINLAIATSTPDTDAGNTTPNATTNANRVSLNTWKRAVPAPFDRVIDLAAVLENSLNGGLWANPAHQGDGRHTSQAGNLSLVGNGSLLQTLP